MIGFDFEKSPKPLKSYNTHPPGARRDRFWFNGRGLANNFSIATMAGLLAFYLHHNKIEKHNVVVDEVKDEKMNKDVFAKTLELSDLEMAALNLAKTFTEAKAVVRNIFSSNLDTTYKIKNFVDLLVDPENSYMRFTYIKLIARLEHLAFNDVLSAKIQSELEEASHKLSLIRKFKDGLEQEELSLIDRKGFELTTTKFVEIIMK